MSLIFKNGIIINSKKLKITALYLIFLGSGVWQLIPVFEKEKRILATPTLIGLALWLVYEVIKSLPSGYVGLNRIHLTRFGWWSILVVILSMVVESIGVWSGVLFGEYQYGPTLSPIIVNIPLGIGVAWLIVFISSITITQRILNKLYLKNIVCTSLTITTVMVTFDYIMEPAAVSLEYWSWRRVDVPLQNYACWFVIGFVGSLISLKSDIFHWKITSFAIHVYASLIMFFVIVQFGKTGALWFPG